MSFSLYLDRIIGRYASFHAFVISGVADRDSPNTSLNEISYQVFQACNHPPDAWNFSIFNCFAKPRAFSFKIVSLIGMFSDICISKHLQQAKSACSYVLSFICYLLVPPLLLNAAMIFSLFFFHVERVFFGTFFRDIFVGKPSVNFHRCCIFHVQYMLVVTPLIPCNAGHFSKITAPTTLLQNKVLRKHF